MWFFGDTNYLCSSFYWIMRLKKLTILNYKNIAESCLTFSSNVNCFVGRNGMGKTNVLDAIYYLSFCKSRQNSMDAQVVRHGEEFFMLQGSYEREEGGEELVHVAFKKGLRKRLKRNDKEYKRLSEHLGQIPLVMISPSDSLLINSGSEERRKFMDMVIAQYDSRYVECLLRYEKSLKQRNALLKQEDEPDWGVMQVLEEMMSMDASYIYECRKAFVTAFSPIFQNLYAALCDSNREEVSIQYASHLSRGDLQEQLVAFRAKERIVGYTLHGVHRDDLELFLNDFPIRQEGSQGQTKTYFIAMKLAQFLYLKERGNQRTPLLLLDDIFDKLDAGRVARIIDYVSGNSFGQIFITDTNREHLDGILEATTKDYKLFHVVEGEITE